MAYHTSSTQGLRYLYTPPLHKIGARFNLPTLSAANGTSMRTWGKCTLSLVLDSKRQYTHQFYLADVTRPILGADFFTANGLAIDLRGKRPLSLDNVSFLLKESCKNGVFKKLQQKAPHIADIDGDLCHHIHKISF
ncbi:hypothetical protein RRG08_063585 [Elysia crispata]|uniref:Uncharacterized protein n=1 Tax=Elysia crispata TaxID=231223 RepID=A0AAE0YSQ2_9GAST|nr:hypothetical protein RRG08_063585 [Elysia crispata]